VPHRDRRTKAKKYKELDDDLTYTANQLDRDVVAENQIRLVIRTFKETSCRKSFRAALRFPKRWSSPRPTCTPKTSCGSSGKSSARGTIFVQKIHVLKSVLDEARKPSGNEWKN
jgi:hypothetical protein